MRLDISETVSPSAEEKVRSIKADYIKTFVTYVINENSQPQQQIDVQQQFVAKNSLKFILQMNVKG